MPLSAPHSLSADDVYALIAYILNFNNIVPSDFVCRPRDLTQGEKCPTATNFIWKDPRPDTAAKACMTDCIDPKSVKVHVVGGGQRPPPRTTGPLGQDEREITVRKMRGEDAMFTGPALGLALFATALSSCAALRAAAGCSHARRKRSPSTAAKAIA